MMGERESMARISEEDLKWIVSVCERDGGNKYLLEVVRGALKLKQAKKTV